jgi:O-antigen/teichoic acid export membrane protein
VLLTQIGARSDAIIIGQWWPAEEVGRFHAAAGVLTGLNLVVAMAVAALYPALVRVRASGEPERVWTLTAPVLAGGLALASTVMLLAPLVIYPLLDLLLGNRFAGAGPPLLVLRWALPCLVITGVVGVVLRSRHADRPLALVALSGAVVSLLINLALIPSQGALGAAISTVTAEVVMAGFGLVLLWRERAPLARAGVVGGLTGLLAGGVGLVAAPLGADSWWLTAACAIVAASAVLLLAAGGAMIVRRTRPRFREA